jgi:hypothetical protein
MKIRHIKGISQASHPEIMFSNSHQILLIVINQSFLIEIGQLAQLIHLSKIILHKYLA